jgi:hypothetical protein
MRLETEGQWGYHLAMASTSDDSEGLNDRWRLKLEETQARYSEDPTEENRKNRKRTLAVFTDLVMRNKTPAED